MDLQELIMAIRAIQDEGVRLGTIEKECRIPANNLSGMLNGGRKFGEKYQRRLSAYVLAYRKSTQESPEPEAKLPFPPPPVEEGSRKLPPAGLSKSQTLKWHRLNSQTLQ